MKIVLITGNNLRHFSFISHISKVIKVDLIISQKKIYPSKKLRILEKKLFNNVKNQISGLNIVEIESLELNSSVCYDMIRNKKPDFIFTFGCGLLKPKIFNLAKKGCINLHTGLTQYYRGVDSALWAIYDDRFDRIGVTLHYIDNSIDGGGVIDQRKLDFNKIKKEDNINSIFIKVCLIGFELFIDNMKNILNDDIIIRDTKIGKLFQNKDKTKKIVEIVNKKITDFALTL